ncbi:hypothetical protein EV142_102168 [Flavobacterium circumlabens]|uniref:Uncharacterized protein n=1 Tax=Flavobacterium circumlabens TaxID=2133765 RepID=A0ABY2B118_9FLAO|nr:hypothetical protein EV142_102168 [Flavobacterium circumlabens]
MTQYSFDLSQMFINKVDVFYHIIKILGFNYFF